MTTAGLLGESFANEVMDAIWEFTPVQSLVDYGNTSRVNRARVQIYFQRSISKEVKPFCKETSQFLELVWETGSIVSGSVALAVLEPRRLRVWTPNDMDVYTTSHEKDNLIAYLIKEEGYEEESNLPATHSFYSNRVLKQVIKLVNGKGKRIEIMVVDTKSPVTAVLSFYGTHVMNILSGRGILAVYPRHTLSKRAIYNTALTPYLLRLPFAIQKCIVKYSSRDYVFSLNAVHYLSAPHVCGESYSCPHSTRNLMDKGGMTINTHIYDNQFTPNTAQSVLQPGYSNQWRLAGDPCDFEKEPFGMGGFVREIDTSIIEI